MKKYTDNLVPRMTGYNTPSGIVTASSILSNGPYDPWRIFNTEIHDKENGSSSWCATTTTGWVAYEFTEKIRINQYSLVAFSSYYGNNGWYYAMPSTWTFEGTNDDKEWVILDKQVNIKDWGDGVKKYFQFNNSIKYKKYRLNVISNNGNSSYLEIGGMEMMSSIENYLIKKDNKYYSIDEKYYINKTYTPIQELIDKIPTKQDIEIFGFNDLSLLINKTTISNEEFKPIDKFDSFQIISDSDKTIKIDAIKSKKELVLGKNSFSVKISKNIDYFKLKDSSENIKMIFSINDGQTWKTFMDNKFEDLSINIPNKEYKDFDNNDLQNWSNVINIIEEKGIDCKILEYIDFNKLKLSSIKFAYLLIGTDSKNISKMKEFIWQFDSNGTMKLCNENEVQIEAYYAGIKLTSKIDNDILKTNIISERK